MFSSLLPLPSLSWTMTCSVCLCQTNNAFAHARAPAHRPRLRTSLFFFWKSAIKANVVGSQCSLNYRGPGSSSRPRGLPPASADPDRTHFTTLTIWDGESPSADNPGPSADDLPSHPQTTSGHPQTTSGHPQTTTGPSADDFSGHPQTTFPAICKQTTFPAICKQTTSGHLQADDHGS